MHKNGPTHISSLSSLIMIFAEMMNHLHFTGLSTRTDVMR